MVTAVDICNMALSHIGEVAEVTSISPPDGSAQAALCARFYPIAREAVLQMHSWTFATKRAVLVALDPDTHTNEAWEFGYAIPADCMTPLAVLPEGAAPTDLSVYEIRDPLSRQSYRTAPIQFTVEHNADNEPALWTNLEDARLLYQAFVTDPQLFSPLCVDALSWKLASFLAGPILKGEMGLKVARQASEMFMFYLQQAATRDANTVERPPVHVPSWLAARG